jgi:uncharacterized protein (DUF58 family)
MEASELLQQVRKIEIKTRGLSDQIFAGEYHSAFKGKGMVFSEVREYMYGDEIRSIDWNVTARFNRPYVKIFEEERELTVMLLIDVSGSREFGTTTKLKKNLVTEIAAVLSFSAIQNNDKIGVIFFTNSVEKFIPPQKGKKHILRIIRELIDFYPDNKTTNLIEPLRFLTNAMKKRCIAFIISDFFAPDFEEALRIANNKHDVVAIKIYDPREMEVPKIGLLKLKDAESGIDFRVDTSNRITRKLFADWWKNHDEKAKDTFLKTGVDSVSISTSEDYVKQLLKLFKQR